MFGRAAIANLFEVLFLCDPELGINGSHSVPEFLAATIEPSGADLVGGFGYCIPDSLKGFGSHAI